MVNRPRLPHGPARRDEVDYMSDSKDQERKAPLKLSQPGKLELKKTVEAGQVRQSFSHGRSKVVTVEVRKKRTFSAAGGAMHEVREGSSAAEAELAKAVANVEMLQQAVTAHDLTPHERNARAAALEAAKRAAEDARLRAEEEARQRAEEDARALIVGGFAEPIAKELPLEYAVEMNNLIHLEMKGSIG